MLPRKLTTATKDINFWRETIGKIVLKREVLRIMSKNKNRVKYKEDLKDLQSKIIDLYVDYNIPYERESMTQARHRLASRKFIIKAAHDLKSAVLKITKQKFLLTYYSLYSLLDDKFDSLVENEPGAEQRIAHNTELILTALFPKMTKPSWLPSYTSYYYSDTNMNNIIIWDNIKYLCDFFGFSVYKKDPDTQKVNFYNLGNMKGPVPSDKFDKYIDLLADKINDKVPGNIMFFGIDVPPLFPEDTDKREESLVEKQEGKNETVQPDTSPKEQPTKPEPEQRKQIFKEKFFEDYPMFTSLRCLYDDVAVSEKEKSFMARVMGEYLQEFNN